MSNLTLSDFKNNMSDEDYSFLENLLVWRTIEVQNLYILFECKDWLEYDEIRTSELLKLCCSLLTNDQHKQLSKGNRNTLFNYFIGYSTFPYPQLFDKTIRLFSSKDNKNSDSFMVN